MVLVKLCTTSSTSSSAVGFNKLRWLHIMQKITGNWFNGKIKSLALWAVALKLQLRVVDKERLNKFRESFS